MPTITQMLTGAVLRRALRVAAACAGIVIATSAARANEPLRIPRLQFGSGFDQLSVVRLPPNQIAMRSQADRAASGPIIADSSHDAIGCITPLPDVAMCEQRSWHYAMAEVLVVQRDNQSNNVPLVIDTITNQTVLSAGDLEMPVSYGARAFFGARRSDGWGWEAGYLGIYGMGTSQTLTGAENLQLAGPLANQVLPFFGADIVTATYSSSLQSGEINIFRSYCHTGQCGSPSCDAGACGNRGGCCVDWLGGFRYVNLAEQAGMTFTCCTTEPVGPFTSSYDVQTSNNLFGGQFGGRAARTWRNWAVEGWAKTGVFANVQNQSQDPVVDPLDPTQPRPDRLSGSGVQPAMLADLNLSVVYRISRVFGVRVGYNALWVGNVALAPEQWDFNTSPGSGSALAGNGGLFVNGVNFGIDACW